MLRFVVCVRFIVFLQISLFFYLGLCISLMFFFKHFMFFVSSHRGSKKFEDWDAGTDLGGGGVIFAWEGQYPITCDVCGFPRLLPKYHQFKSVLQILP